MIIPPIFASRGWHTSGYIAKKLKRSHRTVQHWCKTGFFSRRGCIVLSTTGGRNNQKGSRYWIYVPPMSKDAMLKRINLDMLPPLSVLSTCDEGAISRSGTSPV